ncbi:LacI family DNA-binding transcriptional regulator [Robbsia sp. KACC 23696]|uniref:LacI family DNA-binding transcriptional regulator n=1 Tax=Robbsia sp. KACC 23696 TaxID=3149231 RepID=UPI00325B2117
MQTSASEALSADAQAETDSHSAPLPAVRLKDVADELRISISTVSRSLAGHPAISEATREAVRATAARLGYRVPAQGPRSRRTATKLVGVVVGALHNPFMTVLLTHLYEALNAHGYQIALMIDPMTEPGRIMTFRPLIDGYLDGLIFATATLDSPIVAEMQRRGVPLALVVRAVENVPVDTVEIDNVHAGALAAEHLYQLGHRRIGLVMGPRNTSTSRDRAQGVVGWLADNGVAPDNLALVWGDYTSEAGYSSAVSMVGGASPVTAIVAGNDTIALGVLEAAKRYGVPVPGRLSVVGFDDMPLAGSPLVRLTSIRQPVALMAQTAARRLVDRIKTGSIAAAVRDVLPVHLVCRDTTGPCPDSGLESGDESRRN